MSALSFSCWGVSQLNLQYIHQILEVGFENRTRFYRIIWPKAVVTYENSINWLYFSATRYIKSHV